MFKRRFARRGQALGRWVVVASALAWLMGSALPAGASTNVASTPSAGNASATAAVMTAAEQPAVPPPGAAAFFICPVGSRLCIAPANDRPEQGTPLRLINTSISQSNRNEASWVLTEIDTVGPNSVKGVTKKWIHDHLGWGMYVIHLAYHEGLCLGKTSLRSVRLSITRSCNTYLWVWSSGHEMFSFHYGPRTPIIAPFCISIFGPRARINSVLSLALVGEAKVQHFTQVFVGLV